MPPGDADRGNDDFGLGRSVMRFTLARQRLVRKGNGTHVFLFHEL
jgi:hypothetical protein